MGFGGRSASALHELAQPSDYASGTTSVGLWHPPQLKGPCFHDGKAPTLADAVDHYVGLFNLKLSEQQKRDLVEYLKTL